MSNPQHPVPPRPDGFDLWCSQLQLAGERCGSAWAQLSKALEEYRARSLAVSSSPLTVRESRLPESTREYLAIVRTVTDLIERGPAAIAESRHPPEQVVERRLACRYPVHLDLEYRLLVHGEVIGAGRGRTVNTSSTGILFESDLALPVHTIIQLRVEWPESPTPSARVELNIAGRTVRRQDKATAVAIERHEFRISREANSQDKPFSL